MKILSWTLNKTLAFDFDMTLLATVIIQMSTLSESFAMAFSFLVKYVRFLTSQISFQINYSTKPKQTDIHFDKRGLSVSKFDLGSSCFLPRLFFFQVIKNW